MKKEIDGVVYDVPQHMAVIMDGNGRWAKKRLMPRVMGHRAGAKTLERCCEEVWDLGVKYFTVYAFSTENWKRSADEVAGIMDLFRTYMKDLAERGIKNNMRIRIIGDKTAIPQDIQDMIRNIEEKTAPMTGLQFNIAINYGGRDEIRRMAAKIAGRVKAGEITEEDITEEYISGNLDTWDIPDPDLLIRTSGEERISNYLLWQLAYAEFYFTDVLWPDMNRNEFIKAIKYYSDRDRRYGGAK